MNDLKLKSVALFSSLPGSEIEFLSEVMKRVEIEEGTVLFQEGDHGDKFYIILAGQVEILKSLGKANEQVLGVRGPADFFGEIIDGALSAAAGGIVHDQVFMLDFAACIRATAIWVRTAIIMIQTVSLDLHIHSSFPSMLGWNGSIIPCCMKGNRKILAA